MTAGASVGHRGRYRLGAVMSRRVKDGARMGIWFRRPPAVFRRLLERGDVGLPGWALGSSGRFRGRVRALRGFGGREFEGVGGGGERGSGTVWVLAFAALVWIVAVTVISAGGVRAARHRAHGAADLAALAAAAKAAEGGAAACRRAAVVAQGAGGRLSSCAVRGSVADVEVAVIVRLPAPLGRMHLISRARAGPQRLDGVS